VFLLSWVGRALQNAVLFLLNNYKKKNVCILHVQKESSMLSFVLDFYGET